MDEIFTRRSIRKFTRQAVTDEQVEMLLRAAMAAPSARDQRPWQFVVVRDRALLEAVPQHHPYASMVPQAQAAILVCADPQLEPTEGYWSIDCAAATQNILLEATALGLGAVWLGVYPREERIAALRELFAVPEPIIPFALIPVGHPGELLPPSERFDKSRIHNDRW